MLWQSLEVPPGINRVIPAGLNNSGNLVVGALYDNRSYIAYRQLIGRYFKLSTQPSDHSMATSVNDNGDIAGVVFPIATPDRRTAVVWERGKPTYTVVGPGRALHVTNDRKVLTDQGVLFDLATKTAVSLGATPPFVLDNGRIFGWGFNSIPEWNTSGQLVATYNLGVEALGVNSQNTLFGGFGPNPVIPGLWRNGTWTAIQADKLPLTWGYGDVNDDETLIGNYRTIPGDIIAARWVCAP